MPCCAFRAVVADRPYLACVVRLAREKEPERWGASAKIGHLGPTSLSLCISLGSVFKGNKYTAGLQARARNGVCKSNCLTCGRFVPPASAFPLCLCLGYKKDTTRASLHHSASAQVPSPLPLAPFWLTPRCVPSLAHRSFSVSVSEVQGQCLQRRARRK